MRRLHVLVVCLAMMGSMFLPRARADNWNKKTVITFSGPVEIPGMVLPAGTYMFKLMDSLGDRNIVQIFNANGTHLFATILAISNFRMTTTNRTVITFSERPLNTPIALHAWFYPGDNFGQEFVYPKSEALALAKANQAPVLTMPREFAAAITAPPAAADKTLRQAPIAAVEPSGQEVPAETVVAPQPPAPPSAEIAAAAPPPALPKTASELPLIALLGTLLLAAGLGMLAFTRRRAAA